MMLFTKVSINQILRDKTNSKICVRFVYSKLPNSDEICVRMK